MIKAVVLETRGPMAAVLRNDGVIEKVRRRCQVGEVIYLPERRSAFTVAAMSRFVAAAAAVMLLFFGVNRYTVAAYSYVSLDINPSIEYTLNRLDRVIMVTPLNDDAVDVTNALIEDSVKNNTLSYALEMTEVELRELGFIEDGENSYVLVNISTDNDRHREELKGEVDFAFGGREEKDGFHLVVDTSRRDDRERASQMGISTGRYRKILSIEEQKKGERPDTERMREAIESYGREPVLDLVVEAGDMEKPPETEKGRSGGDTPSGSKSGEEKDEKGAGSGKTEPDYDQDTRGGDSKGVNEGSHDGGKPAEDGSDRNRSQGQNQNQPQQGQPYGGNQGQPQQGQPSGRGRDQNQPQQSQPSGGGQDQNQPQQSQPSGGSRNRNQPQPQQGQPQGSQQPGGNQGQPQQNQPQQGQPSGGDQGQPQQGQPQQNQPQQGQPSGGDQVQPQQSQPSGGDQGQPQQGQPQQNQPQQNQPQQSQPQQSQPQQGQPSTGDQSQIHPEINNASPAQYPGDNTDDNRPSDNPGTENFNQDNHVNDSGDTFNRDDGKNNDRENNNDRHEDKNNTPADNGRGGGGEQQEGSFY